MTEEQTAKANNELPWEEDNKELIAAWRTELKALKAKGDGPALERLKTAVETQLALADLKIKARQADHAQQFIWGPILLTFVGVILGALIAGWVKHC
jgi:anti-sigma-K factor RskA